MPAVTVETLQRDKPDIGDNIVQLIFTAAPPRYAIYATDRRVMVQYADDASLAAKQRSMLAPLGVLRSEINGLINGWRCSKRHSDQARVTLFDRRTADALVLALEGDCAGAYLALDAVRTEILDRRTSVGRFKYLGVALLVALAALSVAGLLLALVFYPEPTHAACRLNAALDCVHDGRNLVEGVMGGTLGAFFSIANGLSTRNVLTDLQPLDNSCDATLRMLIGIISAMILVCLLHSGMGIKVLADGDGTVPWMQFLAIGFVAGFSERMVPDLLAKAAAAIEAAPLPARVGATSMTPIVPGFPPTAADPVETSTSVPDDRGPEETGPENKTATLPAPQPIEADLPPAAGESGDCLSDAPIEPDMATPDPALPAARGGVEGDA